MRFNLGLLFAGCLWLLGIAVGAEAGEVLRVMTFNLWHGGDAGRQPLSQTAAAIKLAGADVVGLQETHGFGKDGVQPDNGLKLSEMLGWSYLDQGNRTGVLSRYPIVSNTPKKWGVLIRVPKVGDVWMFNAHLAHAPYQPYQLLKIPYANAPFIQTGEEAVQEARKARGGQVSRMVEELKPILASRLPVFLTGDFNEPSHLDWTPRAAAAGRCPVAVAYPSTKAVVDAGMKDSFRTVFPDEVAKAGNTWTPTTSPDDPKDRHDRIDFVFFGGDSVVVKSSQLVGESKAYADLVMEKYPSDHRGVVSTFEISATQKPSH